ncbi:MAG: YceI family protein [Dongiaceae bacterium]
MRLAGAIGLAACIASLATAAPAAERFAIDPSHSNILFLVGHLGYSRMVGQFQEFTGEFTFDEQAVEGSAVAVTISAASIDTDDQARDDHLRSPDFFNAAEFPEITFVSTAIERTGDNTGRITGELTLLGVTKPVTLDVTFNQKAPHPLPQYNGVLVAGFSGRTKILRSDFGMSTFAPAIGDEIEILLEVEGQQAP